MRLDNCERELPDTFCSMPFIRLDTTLNGSGAPCCEYRSPNDEIQDSVIKVWNSKEWTLLRKQIVAGERPKGCDYCWKAEDAKVKSLRKVCGEIFSKFMPNLDKNYNFETGELSTLPATMTVYPSNLCNLACRMCKPSISTTLNSKWNEKIVQITGINNYPLRDNQQYKDTLFRDIGIMGPTLSQIAFGGGEPFMIPKVIDILIALQPYANNMSFFTNTNCTKLMHGNINIIDLIQPFKYKILCVSIDGPPELNEYIRHGTNHSAVLNNINLLMTKKCIIHTNTAVTIYNILHIADTFKYIMKEINPECITIHISQDRSFTDPAILSSDLRLVAETRLRSFISEVQNGLYPNVTDSINRDLITCSQRIVDYIVNQPTTEKLNTFVEYTKEQDRMFGTDILSCNPEFSSLFAV